MQFCRPEFSWVLLSNFHTNFQKFQQQSSSDGGNSQSPKNDPDDEEKKKRELKRTFLNIAALIFLFYLYTLLDSFNQDRNGEQVCT